MDLDVLTEVEEYYDYPDDEYYYYDDEEFHWKSIHSIWENCIVPSTVSILPILYQLIGVNFIFGLIISTIKLPQVIFNIFSALTGLYLINTLELAWGKLIVVTFFSLPYFILYFTKLQSEPKKFNPKTDKTELFITSKIVKYSMFTVLVLFEYFLLDKETWLEIRGIVMIFAMKLISLTEDVENNVTPFPTISQYVGYVFCGADILLGPWITFQQYIALFYNPTKKNIWWILGIIRALIVSITFLFLSNCFIHYLIEDDANRWMLAYREAFTYRTSHYFICYLSEASMLSAGYKNKKIWDDNTKWEYTITDPVKTELPTALSIVVTYWNRPMHKFLKKYIYKSWLPLGRFYGILATFIASSCLHGFEIKVSVVLISIGIFSYVQFLVRNYLAETLDSCIKVYPCTNCNHKYKRSDWRCRIYQLIFGFFTVLHLIYLGMLMDPSTDNIGIYGKWNNLYFISFWVMVFDILIII